VQRIKASNLNRGLVGAWCPSVAGNGLLLPDLSGYGNHGTLTGMDASDWVGTDKGRALDFDGSNDYVSVASSGSINIGGALSLHCDLRTGSNITAQQHILTRSYLAPSFNISYRLYIQTDTFVFYVSSDGGASNRCFMTSTAITTNTPYSLSATFVPSVSMDIHLNGRIANTSLTGSLQSAVFQSNSNLFIGCQGDTNTSGRDFFGGALHEARIYNRALTLSEIKQLYEGGPGYGLRQERKRSRFQVQGFNAGRYRRQQLIGTGVY